MSFFQKLLFMHSDARMIHTNTWTVGKYIKLLEELELYSWKWWLHYKIHGVPRDKKLISFLENWANRTQIKAEINELVKEHWYCCELWNLERYRLKKFDALRQDMREHPEDY